MQYNNRSISSSSSSFSIRRSWVVLLLLALSRTITAKATDQQHGKFLWFSDVHYDPFYGTALAKNHRSTAPCNDPDKAPPFSAPGCGSSHALLESLLAKASSETLRDAGKQQQEHDLDFVLFTGDATRHSAAGNETVLYAMHLVTQMVQDYFPDLPIVQLPILDYGNNDLQGDYYLKVTSDQPCFVGPNGSHPPVTNPWLETVAHEFSELFLNPTEQAVYACGGYMNRRLPSAGGFHILVLNTIPFSIQHTPQSMTQDPFGQWAWLKATLQDIRESGEKAYVTGHIPPMLQSYIGGVGDELYQSYHSQQYYNIVHEYRDVIAGQFFGHVHSNELRSSLSMDNDDDDAPPMLISASVSPCYQNFPTFSFVTYDAMDTKQPTDLAVYRVDLTNPYAHNNDETTTTNPWELYIPSVTDFLGLDGLTNAALRHSLFPRLLNIEDNAFDKYYEHGFRYGDAPYHDGCNASAVCRREQACLVACGHDKATWLACNASTSTDATEACRV